LNGVYGKRQALDRRKRPYSTKKGGKDRARKQVHGRTEGVGKKKIKERGLKGTGG